MAPESGAEAWAPPHAVVLVGGRSRRFGRDKLREPIDGRPLVEHAIATLRKVLDAPVAVIGECDPTVRDAGDLWLPDDHRGCGPIGGIVTALRRLDGSAMVLAGDLPSIDAETIVALIESFRGRTEASVAIAVAEDGGLRRRHPCTAIYAPAARPTLESRLESGRFGLLAAIDTLPPDSVIEVECDPNRLVNVNEPGDLSAIRDPHRT